MMKALLWKDLRIFGDVFLGGLVLLFASYFLAFLLVYSDRSSGFEWSKAIAGGASLTRFSSLLICALFGGYAFARESEDGSLLFLAALPARRTHILASKMIVAVAMVVVTWVVSLSIMGAGFRAMRYGWEDFGFALKAMAGYQGLSLLAFGAAWILSFYLNTAVGSAFAGLTALAPVCMGQFLINWYFQIDNPAFFHPAVVVAMFLSGAFAVAGGCLLFVRFGAATEETRVKRSLGLQRYAPETSATAAFHPGRGKAGEFAALLWKDFRLIKAPLLIGMGLVALPYLIVAAGEDWLAHARTASVISIALGGVVFAFWSGHIMTAESQSRTDEFLAYLPASRVKVLASRLAVAFLPMALIAAVNLGVLIAANNAMPGEVRFDPDVTWESLMKAPHIIMGLPLSNGAVLAFGLAWFTSAYYRRPAVAIVLGALAAPLGVGLWVALSSYSVDLGFQSPFRFACLFSSAMLTLSATLIAAGCLIVLKK